MSKRTIPANKHQEPIVRTLFASGVNDPVTCVYAQSSTGFFYFGTVTGSVRAVFPSNQATSRRGSDSKSDPQNPYSLIVLTRRSDEGIRTVHADSQGFVFAGVGDRHVKVWDLSNLSFDRPLVLGAAHEQLLYSRTHTYTRCINTYVLQGEGTIAMMTTGGHTMHIISREPPGVAGQSPKVAEKEVTDKLIQATDVVVVADADAIAVSVSKADDDGNSITVSVLEADTGANDITVSVSQASDHADDNAQEKDFPNSKDDAKQEIDTGVESDTSQSIETHIDEFSNIGSGKTSNITEVESEDIPIPRLSISSHATMSPEDVESDAAIEGLNPQQPKSIPTSYTTLGFDPFDEPCGALDFPHVSLREERIEFGLPRGTVPMSLTNKYISWIQSERPDHYVASVWDWRKGEEVWTGSFPQSRHRHNDLPLGFLVVDEWLACIHYRRQVLVRNVVTGKVVAKLGEHSKAIVAIAAFRDISANGVAEGARTPVVVTVGLDFKLKVWRDLKLFKTLTLPREKARFALGLPYLVTANAKLDRFFYTDDGGLHVVEC